MIAYFAAFKYLLTTISSKPHIKLLLKNESNRFERKTACMCLPDPEVFLP